MGTRVVKLDPVHGFAAETSAATIIFGASTLGMPVSTTHIISSAIMGTGVSDRFNAVRWGVARNIGLAWIITLPAAGISAALAYVVLNPILGAAGGGLARRLAALRGIGRREVFGAHQPVALELQRPDRCLAGRRRLGQVDIVLLRQAADEIAR